MPAMGYRISPSMSNLIQACLQLDPILRPSFDDILIFCQHINFDIVPGADSRAVFEYVSGVTDWESCHSGDAELGQQVEREVPIIFVDHSPSVRTSCVL
jgi:hypothetical protein